MFDELVVEQKVLVLSMIRVQALGHIAILREHNTHFARVFCYKIEKTVNEGHVFCKILGSYFGPLNLVVQVLLDFRSP